MNVLVNVLLAQIQLHAQDAFQQITLVEDNALLALLLYKSHQVNVKNVYPIARHALTLLDVLFANLDIL